jgi:hypothetical protein
VAVGHVARARHRRALRAVARKSKSGRGWGEGFTLHAQCDEAGRLCGFDSTTATGADRKLLAPLTRWMTDGLGVGAGGYRSQAQAKELAPRGGYWLTATRKHCATSPVNSTWRVSHFATAGRKSAHFSRLRVALSAPLSARVLRPLFTCGVAYEPLPSTTP